ncbi:hypothetical protein [Nocardioides sp. KR10-350]|uniref:hypothetical protein n=1 Tax=Nocardioides cheoyonin TaxID=3156615 RepID=UPI0032B3E540
MRTMTMTAAATAAGVLLTGGTATALAMTAVTADTPTIQVWAKVHPAPDGTTTVTASTHVLCPQYVICKDLLPCRPPCPR